MTGRIYNMIDSLLDENTLLEIMLEDIGRPKNFAVDYDGTLNRAGFYKNDSTELHRLDKDIIEFMRLVKEEGHNITVWTCRSGFHIEKMRRVLDENEVPYDYINEYPPFDTGSPKIVADFYIDDRGVNAALLKNAIKNR